MRIKRLYHRVTWDLRPIPNVEHRKSLQRSLDECDAPFHRIRRRTGKRVPVSISDLSRFQEQVHGAHWHVTGAKGRVLAHGLADVTSHDHHGHDHQHAQETSRAAALGLYWLPTTTYPAGRVELDVNIVANEPLFHEVFLAEGAHAFQYGAMTQAELQATMALFHDTPDHPPHGPSGSNIDDHFEGHGSDYWSWPGERFMSLFMAATAPNLPRPLERRQPWTHHYDQNDVHKLREILGMKPL